MRINQYIAQRYGLSRRKAEDLIMEGKVLVNGEILQKLAYMVRDEDVIEIEGAVLEKNEKKYYMLNKPKGVITTSKEQFGRACVTDIVKSDVRVYPVGRLDMWSEGLIVLTNDGELTNAIVHPRQHVGKTYELLVNKLWLAKDVEMMRKGIEIDGKVTLPSQIENVSLNKLIITIFEGRNRQLRKMCDRLGYKVQKLKRVKIGKLELGNLRPGEYRELQVEEIQKIFG